MKMRTTTHHGRGTKKGSFNRKHNDRNFDVTKAKHIDAELLEKNKYFCIYDGETFEDAELMFYEKMFSEQLNKTNAKYIANRHPERCKTMAQWKKIKQNAPEESLYQIGKKYDGGEHVDGKTLLACYNELIDFEDEWNSNHGFPFVVLNMALHEDEPTCPPHIHTRRVWYYQDENGMFRLGQEKALELARVELPDPTRPPGRYNNRKMTFDKMIREKWLDILESHGIIVEREPLPEGKGKKSLDKEEYIRQKYEKMKAEAEAFSKQVENLKEEVGLLDFELQEKKNTIKQLEDACSIKTEKDLEKTKSEATAEILELSHLFDEADYIAKELEEEMTLPISDRVNSLVKELLFVWNKCLERFHQLVSSIREKINNIDLFERIKNIPENLRFSGELMEKLTSAQQRSEHTNDKLKNVIEKNTEL